jgi:YegS/Rv2252/BmrU family lipid kinase
MTRRALLIVNAKSRSGQNALDAITTALRRHGIEPTHHETEKREDISPTIVAHAHEADMVVVAGGDGTMNAAAKGVMRSGLPLGIVPTGTANDLARTIDVPPDIEQAVEIIAAGATRRIDLGEVNDELFFNVASIGLSVELAKELTRDLKRRFGVLGYLIASFRVLARARAFHAEIVFEDRRVRCRTLQVAIGNGRFYGGGNLIEADAAIDDGRLDLYSLEVGRVWRVVLMARALRQGRHGEWDEIRSLSGESFEIRTRRPRHVNADGEIVTSTPARFGVVKGAIEVFAPEAAPPPA